MQEHGYSRTLMATMTIRHWRGHRLRALRKGIVQAWVDLQRQRAFRELLTRYGGEVFVRVLETTHADANGWHVHYHVLVFVGHDLVDDERAAFDASWSSQWRSSVDRIMGRAHRPTLEHGVKLTQCWRADYLTKLGIGAELTDVGQAKEGKGRSYWAIASAWLDAGADPSSPDGRLLADYVRDMRGAVVVAWPRTGEFTRRKVDERHPEQRPELRESTTMHDEEWDALRRVPDARARVLEAAERATHGSLDEVVRGVVDELLKDSREAPNRNSRGIARAAPPRDGPGAALGYFAA